MLKLARFLKPFKKEVIIGPAFKLIEAVFELIIPLVMANIIDIGIVKLSSPKYIFENGLLMILLYILGLGFALVCQYFAARASQGFGTNLRKELFSHINSLSLSQIDKIGSSSLSTRLINDIDKLQVAVAMLIRLVVRAPFLVIGSIVMSMFLDLKLSLIFIITAPLIALVIFIIMKLSVPVYKSIQKGLDKISLITKENLGGVRVIRAFSKQSDETQKFSNSNDDLTKELIKVNRISAFLSPLTTLILNVAILSIIWFGGIRVNNGFLTQGQIIAFVNYLTQISLALVVVANLFVIFTKASASAARINEVLDIKPAPENDIQSLTTKSKHTDKVIEFNNVCFSYHNSENALENVSFDIKNGETIGIIGPTGSGKSTIANLLFRFYEVSSGEILINGIPINKIPLKQLRQKISIAPNQPTLVSGSIKDNLLWGNQDATNDEILKSLEISQSRDFVFSLKDNINHKINQGGKNLSGGQKQRLTIARALLKKSDILILDDVSSALDFATDAALRKAIKNQTKDKTVIMISQRTSSIKNADKIIVLDEGEVKRIGTHNQLLKSCELYKEIYLTQQIPSQEVNKK